MEVSVLMGGFLLLSGRGERHPDMITELLMTTEHCCPDRGAMFRQDQCSVIIAVAARPAPDAGV
jgi:hypothetical protein